MVDTHAAERLAPCPTVRATWFVRIVPALLGLAISLAFVGRASLWRDEMATKEFSALSVPSLFRATSHVDRVLTPYYLFMHVGSSWVAERSACECLQ